VPGRRPTSQRHDTDDRDSSGTCAEEGAARGGLRYSPVMSDTSSPSASPGPPNDADKQRQPGRSLQRLKRRGRALVPTQLAPTLHENQFPVLRSDWLQLREKVASLKEPVPYLAAVSWTCVGFTAATLLALLAWLPVDSKLPTKAHMHYTFVAPLLIIAAIAGTVIAIFTFVVVHQAKKMRVASVDSVLTDMAAIYEPYSHTGSGPSA
jgi:hypothetical protein